MHKMNSYFGIQLAFFEELNEEELSDYQKELFQLVGRSINEMKGLSKDVLMRINN